MCNDTQIYFAYGSNMSLPRLQERVRSAKPLGIGWLPEHKLMFHKLSRRDNSGKCDIVRADACTVYGVLFEIDTTQVNTLDGYEGLNHGYSKKACTIQAGEGRCMPAFTYYADAGHVDDKRKPYKWYLYHVVIGAKEANLPEAYINEVMSTESIKDADQQREERELRLYHHRESVTWRQRLHGFEHPRLVSCDRLLSQDERASVE